MKVNLVLEIPKNVHAALWRHLLPRHFDSEEAAFMFVCHKRKDWTEVFDYLEWLPVPPEGFYSRSRYHFELTDEMRGKVIKRGHDLNALVVEIHSHCSIWPARFSYSDMVGFEEFVPHVWWRLKGRPYLAIVVSRFSFDGLVWISNPNTPERLDAIVVGKSVYRPTKLSPLRSDFFDEEYERETLRS